MLEPPGQSFPENKRKTLRKRVDIPCALRIGERISSGRLLDISLGGAFIHTREELAPGLEFELVFRLRIQNRLLYMSVHASVVHAGRFLQDYESFYGIGTRFARISQKNARDLALILNNLRSEPPKRKYELTP